MFYRKLQYIIIRVGIIIVKTFIVFIVLFLLLLWSAFQEQKRLSAAFNCNDIVELRNKCVDKVEVEKTFLKDGELYTVVYLKISESFICFPSGPPAMVFNSRGIKVAVCADIGDSHSFYDEWCRWNVVEKIDEAGTHTYPLSPVLLT